MGQCCSLSKDTVLPPGFGFNPTNEDLIKGYLMPKITGTACPYDVDSIIATIDDLCQWDPSELPSLCSKQWDNKAYCYFFCKWNPYGNGVRFNRKMKGGGFWKKTGKALDIVDSKTKTVIGKRNILVFYEGRTRTDYKIHECEIVHQSSFCQVAPYVVCRLEKPAMETEKTEKMSVETKTQLVDDGTKSGIESTASEYGINEWGSISFSQPLDLLFSDVGESSANITCNGDIPVVATTCIETQLVDNTAISRIQSLSCQPIFSPPHGHGELRDTSGFAEPDESVSNMLNSFYVPGDGSTENMEFNCCHAIQSLSCQPLYSPPHGHGQLQDTCGFAKPVEPVSNLLNIFYVPDDGSTEDMDAFFNESHEPVFD